TTINAIIKRMEDKDLKFVLAAPTGRAAKRMYEATGYEAKTIHRLLEMGGGSDEGFYNKNEDEPLEADCVIIDEMSMVDIWLMKALLAAIAPGSRLIMVGDVDQLPSVGPGQVLKDIMDSEAFPVVRLKHIFRQSGDSHIVENAHKINRGEHIDLTEKYEDFFLLEKDRVEVIQEYLVRLISDVLPRKLSLEPARIQVMTPMRKGALGVEGLNVMLQERLNPASGQKSEYSYGERIFRSGDKVMQIKNNYQLEWEITGDHNIVVQSGTGVFNGDVGVIKQVNQYLKLLEILFDDGRRVYYPFAQLDELELAYAVTIHKSQGSEYPLVILPILNGPEMLMSRNLLYTAVTRAKRCVILIGSEARIQQMIDNDHVQRRYTSLCERLKEAGEMADGA
ncbi:MAG: AAA family ATPase, partial [Lachnospiraceae bacterium]|nr:AAA family ATPase [Lachnospiraceae bacterium]